MKHKHHIRPKHQGGTDDPSNLVELTVEDHAEAHRILWERYGNEYDKIAWQTLSGQINIDEAKKKSQIEGNRRGAIAKNRKYGAAALIEGARKYHKGRPLSLETKEKISRIHSGRPKSENHKKQISEYRTGRFFVTNGKENLFIKGDIPEGYRKGIMRKIHERY